MRTWSYEQKMAKLRQRITDKEHEIRLLQSEHQTVCERLLECQQKIENLRAYLVKCDASSER